MNAFRFVVGIAFDDMPDHDENEHVTFHHK